MKLHEMFPSRYLKQADFPEDMIVTIDKLCMENVAPQDKAEEVKPVLYFRELVRGLVLNRGNGETLSGIFGSDDDGDWVGGRVIVYVDPSIMFAKKRVGGIRLKAAPRKKKGGHFDDLADDLPFDRTMPPAPDDDETQQEIR